MRKFLQTFGLLATFIKVGHKNFMYSGYWVLIGFLLPFHPHSVVNFPSRFIKIVACCLLGKSKGRKQAHFLFFSLARSMMPITSPNFHPHPKVKSTKKKPNRRKKRERGALGLFVVVFWQICQLFLCLSSLSDHPPASSLTVFVREETRDFFSFLHLMDAASRVPSLQQRASIKCKLKGQYEMHCKTL